MDFPVGLSEEVLGSDLWGRLHTITQLESTAECRKIPPSYESRKGKGQVRIQEDQERNALLFFEKGKYSGTHTKKEWAFTNVFRWTRDSASGEIHLEHLRFGWENPIFLFSLARVGDSQYQSLQPHLCKEDMYQAHVLFDQHYIHFLWKIHGPQKSEQITTVYF